MSQLSIFESALGSKVGDYGFDSEIQLAVIQRSSGAFYVAKGGNYADWSLLWASEGISASPATPTIQSDDAALSVDKVITAQLPAPWDSDFGIATQHLAGARSAGDTFTHEANCQIAFTITALNSSGTIKIDFRKQDANNYWRIEIYPDGTFDLSKTVGGSNTYCYTGDGPVTNGSRMRIVTWGGMISVYLGNLLFIAWDAATEFQAATSGALTSLGMGGAVNDLVSWPLGLSGAALAALNELEAITAPTPTPTATPAGTPTIAPTVTPGGTPSPDGNIYFDFNPLWDQISNFVNGIWPVVAVVLGTTLGAGILGGLMRRIRNALNF